MTPASMLAFVNVMVSDPVTAISIADAPQVGDTNGLVELLIVTPVGSVSVKEKFVSAVSAGACTLIRKRELPPASMVLGLKVLFAEIPVPISYTSISAMAGRILVTPGWLTLSAPAGMVFVYVADEAPAGAVT